MILAIFKKKKHLIGTVSEILKDEMFNLIPVKYQDFIIIIAFRRKTFLFKRKGNYHVYIKIYGVKIMYR